MPKGIFTRKVREVIRVVGPSIAYVQLTQGMYSRIDEKDAEYAGKHNWLALWNPKTRSFYAVRNVSLPGAKRRSELLHRVVIAATEGVVVDHKDCDTLNNCGYNLRSATAGENCRNRRTHQKNTAGLKGVRFHDHTGKWQARISCNRRVISLGLHATPELAAKAYGEAAKKYHGEYARL